MSIGGAIAAGLGCVWIPIIAVGVMLLGKCSRGGPVGLRGAEPEFVGLWWRLVSSFPKGVDGDGTCVAGGDKRKREHGEE